MNKDLVIYYVKRHLFGIIGMVIAIAVVVLGVMFKGKGKEAIETAEAEFTEQTGRKDTLEQGQSMVSGGSVKNTEANARLAEQDKKRYENFIANATQVLSEDTVVPMSSDQFLSHMVSVLEELNQRAREKMVVLPTDTTNATQAIPYNFSFMHLRNVVELAGDKVPELQVQLKDIRSVADILFRSRVRSITMLQRPRVTYEDTLAGPSGDYLDERLKYTNNVSVVRPYRIRFECLSGSIGYVLTGLAAEKEFFVVRKMEVTQQGAKKSGVQGGAGGMEGGDGGGMPGGYPPGMMSGGGDPSGGFPGGGDPSGGFPGGFPGGAVTPGAGIAAPKITLSPLERATLERMGLASQKSTNVISETVLEVELDIDVVRKLPVAPDPNALSTEPVPAPGTQPQTNAPPAVTNAPPATNAPPSTNAAPVPAPAVPGTP